ncbi:unnamed protein product [Psylliodes chrysocephalus]|uniref:Small integral membrane protein 4 n=1 Tax=Psylliodes chrysocephalus TaxID=3402493 RepID=A0A9P0DEG7_9CUCU|nr:unnamed protein product [Psylliodes chrysocephala]
MKLYSPKLKTFLNKWPGKRYFGVYRFIPLFFMLGAALEFSMINWNVGDVNFYKTYKKRQAKTYLEQHTEEERYKL